MTPRMRRNLKVALLLPLILPVSAPAAVAQAPKPAAAPATDSAFEAMRRSFEALPEAERRGLQEALVWTGDTNGAVTGGFGRLTFAALNAFRSRTAPSADPLDPSVRAAIRAAGDAARRAARFTVQADPASGIVLGVPERLLPKRSAIPGGTRWQSADGAVTLESRSFPPGQTDLDTLFTRATAPLPERKVTYTLKRPDLVVVTAETATGRSYLRYAGSAEGIRGFALGYAAALGPEIDRIAVAVANSFVPFPGPAGTATPPPAEPHRPAAPPAPARTVTTAPVPAKIPGSSTPANTILATGLVVAPGRLVTASSAVEGCGDPKTGDLKVGMAAARVLRSANGLALIAAEGLPAPARALRFHRTHPSGGWMVVAAGEDGAVVAPANAEGPDRVTAPLQPGAAGAPVLDASGGVAGLVAQVPAGPRLVAGVMPPGAVPLIAAEAVAIFLAGNGIAAPVADGAGAHAVSTGAAATAVAGAVVGLACVR